MRHRYLIAIGVLLLVAVPRAAEKRLLTERDLLRFTWIADPQLTPDGSTIAFVRVTVNDKENRYETSLFAVPVSGAEAPRRLTSNVRDALPRWSPDGRRIAFVRSVVKDGKPQPGQVYVLDMGGGEAYPLTEDTKGVADGSTSSAGWTSGCRAARIRCTRPIDAAHGWGKENVCRALSRSSCWLESPYSSGPRGTLRAEGETGSRGPCRFCCSDCRG